MSETKVQPTDAELVGELDAALRSCGREIAALNETVALIEAERQADAEPAPVEHPAEPAEPRGMTHGDRAHLLRMIARAVTDDGMAAPVAVDMHRSGYAVLQFDKDDAAAVEAWAAKLGATVAAGRTFDANTDRGPWHEFGSRPRGGEVGAWRGWRIDVWCVVDGPSPADIEAEPSNPDRRCRNCGATTGLVMLPYNPLTLDPQQWECQAPKAGCKAGA